MAGEVDTEVIKRKGRERRSKNAEGLEKEAVKFREL